MATPIYSDIPQGGLTSLNTGDKLVFNDKLNFQNPDVQALFTQGVAIPTYNSNQVLNGVEMIKPYVAPGTNYTPPSTVSDLMRNFNTGNVVNLQTQAPKTQEDWMTQGYGAMNTSTVNGGTLNTQNIGGGQQYQEFIQRPAGYGATTPVSGSAGDNIGSMAIRDLQNPTDASGRPINGTVYQAPVLSEAEQRQKLLEEQQKALEAESQAQQAEVRQEFRASRTNTIDTGNRMAGTLQRILGRAGAFTTSSGGQAVIAQATSLQNQLTKLDQAESAALAKVRAAVMTQNANNAAKAWEDIYKIKQDQQDALAQQAALLQDALDRQDKATQQQFENQLNLDKFALEKKKYEDQGIKTIFKDIVVNGEKHTQMFNEATGEFIKDLGVSDIDKGPSSYQEWQKYKQEGGKLDYNGYLNMDANRKKTSVSVNNFPKTTMDGSNITAEIKKDLLTDINVNKRTKEEVMAAYPEVDTAYIDSLYPKSTNDNPFK